MESFLNSFSQHVKFKITNLHKIRDGNGFFNEIVSQINSAKDVSILTLYVGGLSKSKTLFSALQKRVKFGKKTEIIIDHNRNMENPETYQLLREYSLEKIITFVNVKNPQILPNLIYELLYVLHIKIYIFDNNVILSGANLDDTYFTNRLDRYFLITDSKLALYLKKNMFEPFLKDSSSKKIPKNQELISTRTLSSKKFFDDKQSNRECCQKSFSIEPVPNFNSSFSYVHGDLKNTHVIPYRENEELSILKKVFEYNFNEFYLSTAYINLPKPYIDIFREKEMKIIVPNTYCNTFKKKGFINNIIVAVYDYLTVKTKEILPRSKVLTFYKKAASFHFKGIWAFSDNFAITIIGSSNFNERSYRRDTEQCTLIITSDVYLIKQFREETDFLLDHSDTVHQHKKTHFLIRLIAYFFKYFL